MQCLWFCSMCPKNFSGLNYGVQVLGRLAGAEAPKSQLATIFLRRVKSQGDSAERTRFLRVRERSGLCRGPFRDCSLLVLFIGRERGEGQIRNIPGESETNRQNSGRIGKVPRSTKKTKKGQQKKTRKEGQVQIGKPPVETPPV